MTSDGVPRILPANDALFGSGPRGKWRKWRHNSDQRESFFSILLGAPDYASDDTLWLPQYGRSRTVPVTSYNVEQLFKLVMVTLFGEVIHFGTKATGVAKRFAKLKLDIVESLLFNLQDLRSALHQIAVHVPDAECVEPARVLEGASRMMEVKQRPIGDDLVALVRYKNYNLVQFLIFVSIMLGDPQHGAEPSTPFWFHDAALKQRDHDTLIKVANELFNEILKFGARATAVAMAFAKMDSVDVHKLLEKRNIADLRSTLQQFDTVARVRDTEELINTFNPPFEAGPSTADAFLENTGFDVFPLEYYDSE